MSILLLIIFKNTISCKFFQLENYWNTDNCYTLNTSLLNTHNDNNGNQTSSVEEYWE